MKELNFTELSVLAINDEHYNRVLESAVRMLQMQRAVYIYQFDNETVTISDHPINHNVVSLR